MMHELPMKFFFFFFFQSLMAQLSENEAVPFKCVFVVRCHLFYLAVHLCTTRSRGFLFLTLQLDQFMRCGVPGGNKATGKSTVNPLTLSGGRRGEFPCVSSFCSSDTLDSHCDYHISFKSL